jgi:Carbohydrate binding domain
MMPTSIRSTFAVGVRLVALGSLLGIGACGSDMGSGGGAGKGGSSSTGKGGASGKGGATVTGTAGAGGTAGSGGSIGTGTGGTAGSAGTVGSAGTTGTAGTGGAGGTSGSAGTGAGGSSGGTTGTGGSGTGGSVAGSGGGTAGGTGSGGTGGTGTAGTGGSSAGAGGATDAGTDAGDGATDTPTGAGNGTACTSASVCASGYCVDGVCCDTACTGICNACVHATTGAADGVCSPITAGTDPDNDCPQEAPSTCRHDGMCDGNGACRNWAVGITCATESCAAGTYTPARICNGAGTCLDVTTSTCGVYSCGATTCKTSCASNGDCISGYYCAGTTCTPLLTQGTACTSAGQCATGNCVDGVCCESACAGACDACSNDRTGQANGLCKPVTAGTDPDNECAQDTASSCGLDGMCNGAGACRKWAAGTICVGQSCLGSTYTPARTCDGAGTCGTVTTASCGAYACGVSSCKTSCAFNTDCIANSYCANAVCLPLKNQGAPCASNGECNTGSCVDGVCCESACSGSCAACSNAKTAAADGLCRPIIGGTDPDNECAQQATSTCGQDGMCDGAGACRKWTAGTACIGESCSVSTYQPPSTCNGAGTCQTPATRSCNAYMCGATACATSCGSNADCTSGYHCAAGACAPQETNGTACVVTGDCASGFCVDGVCCDTACNGSCQTCAATNSLGTCKNADPGTDPRSECVADDPSTCGHDGTCDGNGGCRKYVATTVCGAASCSSATAHAPSTCDGAGVCNAGGTTPCSPYQCDAAGLACRVACATDADCAGGFCAAGLCYASPLNLAGNGDLEYGNGTQWSTNGGGSLVMENGVATPGLSHGGTYSIADTMRTVNYQGPGYLMPTGAGIYNITAWAMQNDNPDQTVALQVNLNCGNPGGSSFPTIGAYGFHLPQGVWTKVTGTVNFTTTAAACDPTMAGVVNTALLYLNRAGTGTPVAEPNLFLDDVVITVGDGHNLVGNPGFESNVTTPWTQSGGTLGVSTTVFKSGTHSLSDTARNATYQGPRYDLPLGPAKYNVVFNGLHNGAQPHNLVLQPVYTCLGSSTQQFPAPIATATNVGGNGWNTLSGTVTFPPANAPAGCKLTLAGVYMQQEGGTCGAGAGQIDCPDLFVDDVSITLAP